MKTNNCIINLNKKNPQRGLYALLCVFVSLWQMAIFHPAFASTCKITGEVNNWGLEVDGKPFELKGVGCGDITGFEEADYFKLAVEMGANTLRTWGIDQSTKAYLDKAHEYGLKVDAGIWLPHCNWMRQKKVYSYINDPEKLVALEQEALEYVRAFKDHPALIMWNVGNETLFFTLEEAEQIAFAKFLDQLIVKIKAIDPNHPVLYTMASTQVLPILKEHTPHLDILGVNTYGGVDHIPGEMKSLNFSIPFLITEAGPMLPLNRPKDEFGRSIDEADYEKAFHYQYMLEEIAKVKGPCLGGFMFYLGETTQECLTWWNLTYGPYKRESFHVIREFYTGETYDNKPPLCTGITIAKNKVQPGETISVSIKGYDREKDKLEYQVVVGTSKENILKHKVNEIVPVEVLSTGPESKFKAPSKPGVYKLHALIFDGQGNVSTQNIAFKVIEG